MLYAIIKGKHVCKAGEMSDFCVVFPAEMVDVAAYSRHPNNDPVFYRVEFFNNKILQMDFGINLQNKDEAVSLINSFCKRNNLETENISLSFKKITTRTVALALNKTDEVIFRYFIINPNKPTKITYGLIAGKYETTLLNGYHSLDPDDYLTSIHENIISALFDEEPQDMGTVGKIELL